MQTVLAKISQLPHAYTGKKLSSQDIILYQRKAALNDFPPLPADYVELLHHYNSLCYDGSNLLGIAPRGSTELDILAENALIAYPLADQVLFLGFSELEYLFWNQTQNCYQTIDKDSFQVLNTYKTCENALLEFLKLNNDF